MSTFFRPETALVAIACVVLSSAGLTGCAANMSGIGGDTTFKCKAPDGVQCQSVSGTYANARAGTLPSQQSSSQSKHRSATADAEDPAAHSSMSAVAAQSAITKTSFGAAANPGSLGAIRSDPTVIRIWIAPWEDADGDLVDQTYVYLPVDSGRWLIEHNRHRIKREFAPVRAPTSVAAPAKPLATRESEDSPQDGAAAVAEGIARMRNGARPDAQPGAQQ